MSVTPYSATRELLTTDLVILNHGQMTRTTHEMAPPNFLATLTGGRLSLDIFNGIGLLCTAGVQQFLDLT
ncbi:hypothetical protein TNCV_1715991 [Trichonephila clavipes]|nr:hypothetical protein TNCV_1715991 [Trichonephila clavipes]